MTPAATTLTELPLFPLRTVLFPGGSLPLQIFEVRYLDMIGNRHKSGQPFGVVALSEGDEVRRLASGQADGPPSGDGFANEAFFPTGTLAQITRFERPQPGLMTIVCAGTQRFRVERSHKLKHGLWVADVTLVPDDPATPVPDDLAFTREVLRGVARDIDRRSGQDADAVLDSPLPEPRRWDDCGWLANRWCELLPLETELKHRLLALDGPLLRLELVADALGQMGLGAPAE